MFERELVESAITDEIKPLMIGEREPRISQRFTRINGDKRHERGKPGEMYQYFVGVDSPLGGKLAASEREAGISRGKC